MDRRTHKHRLSPAAIPVSIMMVTDTGGRTMPVAALSKVTMAAVRTRLPRSTHHWRLVPVRMPTLMAMAMGGRTAPVAVLLAAMAPQASQLHRVTIRRCRGVRARALTQTEMAMVGRIMPVVWSLAATPVSTPQVVVRAHRVVPPPCRRHQFSVHPQVVTHSNAVCRRLHVIPRLPLCELSTRLLIWPT